MRGTVSRPWQVDVSVGGAAFGVGAGGVLALVIAGGLAEESVWSERWWWIPAILFSLLTALGGYMLAAVYFPVPLPETRAAREAKAQLGISLRLYGGEEFALLEVALQIGHLDIDNGTMNVRVPDWVQISACDERGLSAGPGLGDMAHSGESLDGGAHGLNYWRQGGLRFSAFTATSLYFRLSAEENHGDIPFEFKMSAAALQGTVYAKCVVPPGELRLPPEQPSDDGA